MKQPADLPKNSVLKYQGSIFNVYEWQQKQFDGSYKTFEKVGRLDSVMIVAMTADNKFIILEQQTPNKDKPFVGLAAGRVEEGEDFLTAAKRELREETGYVSDNWHLLCENGYSDKLDWKLQTFIARDCQSGQNSPDSGEKIKLIFLEFEQFLDTIFKDDFRDFEIAHFLLREYWKTKSVEHLKELLMD